MTHPRMATPAQGPTTSARPQQHRRKIEYVPLAREVETAGSRILLPLRTHQLQGHQDML